MDKIYLDIVQKWKNDYEFRMTVKTAINFVVTVIFALFNVVLSIYYRSAWYGGIGAYYVLLALIRGSVALVEIKSRKMEEKQQNELRKKTFLGTSVLLFIMNMVLVAPVTMMVFFQRQVKFDLFLSIGMAAYTVCKAVTTSINFAKRNRLDNFLLKEISVINFIDMLVSILLLQNALIVVNSGNENHDMFLLSAVVSAIFMVLAVGLSIYNLVGYKKIGENDSEVNDID